jgi:hypothetical protein
VERRRQVEQARGTLADGVAQHVEAHAARLDRQRHERRAEGSERVEGTKERRALHERCVVPAQEQGARERDRLLRAARDEHLVLGRRQAAPLQVPRDRSAQRGQAERAVAVLARGLVDRRRRGGDALLDQVGQRRQARAGQVDGTRPRGEAREAGVAFQLHDRARRHPLREAARGRCAAHERAAALPALEALVLPERRVRLHDRRAADREVLCQHPLGGQAFARLDLAALDAVAQRVRQAPIQRTRAGRPLAELGLQACRHSDQFPGIGS